MVDVRIILSALWVAVEFLLEQVGVPFDSGQAIQSALDKVYDVPRVGELTHSEEDLSELFCSEMATTALEVGGVIEHLNCLEVTPPDLFQFTIYQGTYYQIKVQRQWLRASTR